MRSQKAHKKKEHFEDKSNKRVMLTLPGDLLELVAQQLTSSEVARARVCRHLRDSFTGAVVASKMHTPRLLCGALISAWPMVVRVYFVQLVRDEPPLAAAGTLIGYDGEPCPGALYDTSRFLQGWQVRTCRAWSRRFLCSSDLSMHMFVHVLGASTALPPARFTLFVRRGLQELTRPTGQLSKVFGATQPVMWCFVKKTF